jgi:riboflavin kinase/FMN adenylyltransferase
MFSLFFITFAPMKTIILRKDVVLNEPQVATIGCFDGVHRGHRLLIRTVMEAAKERGLESALITFDRQPQELFDPTFRPQLLSTQEEKEALLQALGVDHLVVLPFTWEMAGLTAQAFMQQILRDRLHVKMLVTGYDNRFGRNRSEGFDDYVRYGRALGIEVVRGDEEKFPGTEEAVSSSAIRQLLLEGKVEQMWECLTRPYSLTGKVVQGEHIGHELGFPTANLALDHPDKLIPASGVYAVWALMGSERMPAIMNIGVRPTFHGSRQTLEVHILDQVGDVYGRTLTVEFVKRLRAERMFDTREALVEQVKADKAEAVSLLIK